MKIKKTIFSIEIDFDPDEISDFRNKDPRLFVRFAIWIKKQIGVDLLPK